MLQLVLKDADAGRLVRPLAHYQVRGRTLLEQGSAVLLVVNRFPLLGGGELREGPDFMRQVISVRDRDLFQVEEVGRLGRRGVHGVCCGVLSCAAGVLESLLDGRDGGRLVALLHCAAVLAVLGGAFGASQLGQDLLVSCVNLLP